MAIFERLFIPDSFSDSMVPIYGGSLLDYIYSFWYDKHICKNCGKILYESKRERILKENIIRICSFTCMNELLFDKYPALKPKHENMKLYTIYNQDKHDKIMREIFAKEQCKEEENDLCK